MTSKAIPLAAHAAATPDWRAAQQQATNATWQASGIPADAPFCVSQTERGGAYIGDLHYAYNLAAVQAFATEYGVPVATSPAAGGTCHSARAIVQGVEVRAWTVTVDTETPAGGESA